MVTVNEIAAAFQEALRQYGASDGGSNPIGAMRHPDVHHPSKDTQDAQVWFVASVGICFSELT